MILIFGEGEESHSTPTGSLASVIPRCLSYSGQCSTHRQRPRASHFPALSGCRALNDEIHFTPSSYVISTLLMVAFYKHSKCPQ